MCASRLCAMRKVHKFLFPKNTKKFFKKFFPKLLTNQSKCDIINIEKNKGDITMKQTVKELAQAFALAMGGCLTLVGCIITMLLANGTINL